MTADALIADFRARGITLVVDGDRLRCRPGSALGSHDLEKLRAHKTELLERLRLATPSVPPTLACIACHEHRFWRSVRGVVVCGLCHPPATPDVVADWIGDATGASS